MSSITLTDRITVSVRAKNETQGNSQKRDTGRNIAKALGNDNISDALADQLGNTKNPTITDENGNEWVSMEDIIAAGRLMKENGAFNEKPVYEGLPNQPIIDNSYIYGPMSVEYIDGNMVKLVWTTDAEINIFYGSDDDAGHVVCASKESFTIIYDYYTNEGGQWIKQDSASSSIVSEAVTSAIDGVSYSYFYKEWGGTVLHGTSEQRARLTLKPSREVITSILFGPKHTSGGSLIDWDAPNAEVERQINNLHETWDVTEHEGAVTANGTYVLAGPIEFNPGD